MKAKKGNTRKGDFWNSKSPLTSKRVRIILSNPADSKNLVEAVRSARTGSAASSKGVKAKGIFTLSKKG